MNNISNINEISEINKVVDNIILNPLKFDVKSKIVNNYRVITIITNTKDKELLIDYYIRRFKYLNIYFKREVIINKVGTDHIWFLID